MKIGTSLRLLLSCGWLAACGGGPDTALGARRRVNDGLPGRDCNPHNAYGAVRPMERAMLDTIAEAEGTIGRGKDGYDVMFTYQYFDSCDAHPGIKQCSGRLCSTAAGRYQFLKGTWDSLRLPNFWPENQDRGALALLARRGIQLPNRPLMAREFSYVMEHLSFEWASLPPGRYGQPTFGYQELWERYCFYASCEPTLLSGYWWPDAADRKSHVLAVQGRAPERGADGLWSGYLALRTGG